MNRNFLTYQLNSSISVLRSLVFQIVRKFHQCSLFAERSTAKSYHPVSLLSVVSKVFEKLLNNRIVDHLEKCDLSSDFQFGFRSSRSTADLLTTVSVRIARAFKRSGATRAQVLDMTKAFGKVWDADILHKPKSYGISSQIFGLISSFLGNRQLRVVLDGKS